MKKVLLQLLLMAANIYSADSSDFNFTPLSLSETNIPLPLLGQRKELTEEEKDKILQDINRLYPNLQENLMLNSSTHDNSLPLLALKKHFGDSGLNTISKVITILQSMGLSGKIVYYSLDGRFEIQGITALKPTVLQHAFNQDNYSFWYPRVKSTGWSYGNLSIELIANPNDATIFCVIS